MDDKKTVVPSVVVVVPPGIKDYVAINQATGNAIVVLNGIFEHVLPFFVVKHKEGGNLTK
jgi:hypothetical protein